MVRGLVCAAVLPVLLLSACASSGASPDDVFLPRLDHDNEAWPAALIWGTLFEADGCVFIRAGYEGVEDPDVLLIWPFRHDS